MKKLMCVIFLFVMVWFNAWAAEVAKVLELGSQQAYSLQQQGKLAIIDIRTAREWDDTGVPPAAALITIRTEADFVQAVLAWSHGQKDLPVALICRTGSRSAIAAQALVAAGFTQVMDIREGIVGGRHGPGWAARQLPLQPPQR